jgi:membrane protein
MEKKENVKWDPWVWFVKLPPVKRFFLFLDEIIPPGFQGASFYSVCKFFFKGIISPKFNLYAGSLSWNFFLAIFPSLIFLFTLIAYLQIPGFNLQKSIMQQMDFFLPEDAYKIVRATIRDIVSNQRSGLLSFGFISALYFASNGIFSMMLAFDSNFNEGEKKKRNFFQKRGKSILITIGISLLILLSLSVLVSGNLLSAWIIKKKLINKAAMLVFVNVIQFITLTALVFFIMSSLYYFGHSARERWKFFSPGAIVSTILSIIATYMFSNYVDVFGSYNKLYGSIGAIIVLMLLIYFNTLCILVGFELNKSITTVVKMDQEKRKLENRFKS